MALFACLSLHGLGCWVAHLSSFVHFLLELEMLTRRITLWRICTLQCKNTRAACSDWLQLPHHVTPVPALCGWDKRQHVISCIRFSCPIVLPSCPPVQGQEHWAPQGRRCIKDGVTKDITTWLFNCTSLSVQVQEHSGQLRGVSMSTV